MPGKWDNKAREKNNEAPAKKIFIVASKKSKMPQRRSIAPAKKKKAKGNSEGKERIREKAEEEMGKDNRPLGQDKNKGKLPLVVVRKTP